MIGDILERVSIYSAIKPDITVGDNVLILRKAVEGENGWSDCWNSDMDKYVGRVGIVEDDSVDGCVEYNVYVNGSSWWYPYFVLKKIEG